MLYQYVCVLYALSVYMISLKGLSINVRSIKSTARMVAVFSFLAGLDYQVLFLQECSIPYQRLYYDLSKWWTHGPSVWSGGNDGKSSGVVVLFKGRDFKVTESKELVPGRLLMVDVSYRNFSMRLINVYASPYKNSRFDLFQLIPAYLVVSKLIILAGDFNCVIDSEGRSRSSSTKLDKTSIFLGDLVKSAKLIDVGKQGGEFTWARADGSSATRIDFFFVSSMLKIQNCSTMPVFFSDHRALCFKADLPDSSPPGKGIWKLNIELLTDSCVQELKKLCRWVLPEVLF